MMDASLSVNSTLTMGDDRLVTGNVSHAARLIARSHLAKLFGNGKRHGEDEGDATLETSAAHMRNLVDDSGVVDDTAESASVRQDAHAVPSTPTPSNVAHASTPRGSPTPHGGPGQTSGEEVMKLLDAGSCVDETSSMEMSAEDARLEKIIAARKAVEQHAKAWSVSQSREFEAVARRDVTTSALSASAASVRTRTHSSTEEADLEQLLMQERKALAETKVDICKNRSHSGGVLHHPYVPPPNTRYARGAAASVSSSSDSSSGGGEGTADPTCTKGDLAMARSTVLAARDHQQPGAARFAPRLPSQYNRRVDVASSVDFTRALEEERALIMQLRTKQK